VEINVILAATPAFLIALTESPPPMMLTTLEFAAIASATATYLAQSLI
jgi:hypothetical protein